jgi:predicted transcriptional regulator of viral defense system
MASNTPKKNRTDQTAAEQRLSDGLNKHAQAIAPFVIAGVTVTPKDIITNLQTLIASANTVESTKEAWLNAVKADKDERAKLKAFVSSAKQALLLAFAGSIDTLEDFGLTPRKVAVRTPEQKAVAAAKGKATRVARHTLGTKQKTAITGTVPTTAPGTPAAAPVRSPGATHQS